MAIIIRPENDDDISAVHEVEALAFGRQVEASIVDALRGTDYFIPGLSLVAVRDREIIGHILFTPARIEDESVTTTVLMLAPLAVKPGHQRQGLGSALVKRGLDECLRLGYTVVVLFGHPSYYPRFGFRPAGALGLRPPFECPPEAFREA